MALDFLQVLCSEKVILSRALPKELTERPCPDALPGPGLKWGEKEVVGAAGIEPVTTLP